MGRHSEPAAATPVPGRPDDVAIRPNAGRRMAAKEVQRRGVLSQMSTISLPLITGCLLRGVVE